MRFQMPSYSVCTPMEKGTMIQEFLRLMGVVPLLVMLPRMSTSMELYGRPADNSSAVSIPSQPLHCRKYDTTCATTALNQGTSVII